MFGNISISVSKWKSALSRGYKPGIFLDLVFRLLFPSVRLIFQMIMRSKSIASILPTTEDNEHRHSMLQTIIATLETTKSQLEAKEINEKSPCNEMNDDERMDINE